MNKQERKRLDAYQKKKYGITWSQRMKMFKAQGGKCAICGKHESEFKRRLHTDHNHKTGKVRALLCYYDNRRLVGRHTLETAKKVYEYLLRYDQ